jgi:trehalose 6-phosphate phosphatase
MRTPVLGTAGTLAELAAVSPPLGLFLDVDGTLVDLAEHPDEVVVPPGLLQDLVAAETALGGAVALVSGRPITALDRLFEPVRLRASGVHGAEIRKTPLGTCDMLAAGQLPEASWHALTALLGDFPGTFAENKRVSFAVHFRTPDGDEAALQAALTAFMTRWPVLDLELIPTHRGFELKLAGFDKGRVIDRFMSKPPFAGRVPIFIADDPADWPGFRAVLAQGGLAFSVGWNNAELSGSFPDPAAVRRWLSARKG